ncbi:MAG TPA: DNA polymerase III subunit delta, partial [Treponemataceae bacterium]|nr:DNA polymerase III subunit delta [Treponemataceae bacterium]
MADTAPVWLFTGPEIGERNTAIDDIRQKAVKVLGDLDYHSLYASDTRMGEVISLLQNGSLFSGGRFILLRNAEEIKKKEDVSMVVDWITSAASITDAYLVLVSEDIGIDRKIEAAIPQGHKRVFWEMFEDRKEQWIVNYFRTSGFAIDPDAV